MEITEEAADGPALQASTSCSPESATSPGGLRLRDVDSRKQLKKSPTAPRPAMMPYGRKTLLESSGELVRTGMSWRQAGMWLAVYLAVGVLIYVEFQFKGQKTSWLIDGLYFGIVTMSTIGYGDITPVSSTTKLCCCAFVLVGLGFINNIPLSDMVINILELLNVAVDGGHDARRRRYLRTSRRGRIKKRMKKFLAVVVVASCLAFGCLAIRLTEKLSWLDSFYLSCVSVTTVGYGDHNFKTRHGRMFASVWLLVSSLAAARAYLYLADELIIKPCKKRKQKMLTKRELTIYDLLEADMDNDGYVSKSEYVVQKLRRLGKISDEDLQATSYQFNILDSDNTGRITLSCLSERTS